MSEGVPMTMLHSKMHASASAVTAHDRARISAVIATRHPAMRSSLCAVLDSSPHVHVLGAAGDLRDSMRLLRSFQPDVMVLDAGVLGDEGVRRLPLLRSAAPTTAFLVLGMGDHPAYAAHARRAGAADYVRLDQALDRLPQAIHAAVSL
jgi:DNA-binding NarL/FixJ family response regulator